MRKLWEKIKNLRLWTKLRAACQKAGAFFAKVGKCLFKAVRTVWVALKCCCRWFVRHWKAVAVGVSVAAVAVGVFLALFLTLPVASVEVEGEVLLLQGEEYTGGFGIKATTKAGLVHREEVLPKMLSGLDPDVPGEQKVTIAYDKWRVTATVTVIPPSEVTLKIREGSMPASFEPNDPFPKSGVFDLYYNGKIIRSAPITSASAPEFSSRLSGNYGISLSYRAGISLSYEYTVLEVIQSITPVGVLYAPQGAALSKNNAVGNLSFLVRYKDGTEESVMIYDDRLLLQGGVLETQDADYQGTVSFFYKGVEITCPVTAYKGDLLAPKSVKLHLDRSVYVVGEAFDYSKAHLEVEYERFGGTPVLLRATESSIFLMKRQGDPENYTLVPINDGTAPILFDTVRSYDVVARYLGAESSSVILRVISEEDAARVTALATQWRGRRDGPPVKGQDLEFDGAELTVEYGFGYRAETVPLTAEMVAGYDKNTAGDQDLTITYRDRAETLTLRVADPGSTEVTSVIFVVGWNDPTYYSSDELVVPETAYLEVEIGYGGSPNQKIYLKDNDDVTITGFTPHSLEEQTLTITYKGFVTTQKLTVLDDRTEDIIDFWAPSAIHIDVGDPLDLSGICTVFYSTGREEQMTLEAVLNAGGRIVGEYDTDTIGNYPVRIYHPDFSSTDHATWIYVEGEAVTATGIRLDVENATTTYNVGDSLDITGMKLYLVYSDSSETDVTTYLNELSFTGFATAQTGDFSATVSYLSSEGAFVTSYNYSVV